MSNRKAKKIIYRSHQMRIREKPLITPWLLLLLLVLSCCLYLYYTSFILSDDSSLKPSRETRWNVITLKRIQQQYEQMKWEDKSSFVEKSNLKTNLVSKMLSSSGMVKFHQTVEEEEEVGGRLLLINHLPKSEVLFCVTKWEIEEENQIFQGISKTRPVMWLVRALSLSMIRLITLFARELQKWKGFIALRFNFLFSGIKHFLLHPFLFVSIILVAKA